MIRVDYELFILLYLCTGIATICGLWFYYDRRDKRLYEAERIRVVFHCLKCGQLFTEKKQAEVAECPRCGYENSRIRF